MTKKQIQQLIDQRDALARDVVFAVNHLKADGGGLIMTRTEKGGYTTEYWLNRFRRNLKAVGIEWDDEVLEYGRASLANRKRMLKDSPTLAGKLDAK